LFKFQSNRKKVEKALTDREEKCLESIGAFIMSEAVVRVPVRSGNLRSSINWKVSGRSVVIGTNTSYAPYVEFGTGKYVPGGRSTPWVYFNEYTGQFARTSGMKGRPYLRPAGEDNIERIREIARRVMGSD
jgi:HK97 gp10 family phage protein